MKFKTNKKNNKNFTIMKKFFAIILVSVLAVNMTFAQNRHHRIPMKPRFEMLDSATKANFMKTRAEWEKKMKENNRKWKKQMAWTAPRQTRYEWMLRHGFNLEPQEQMPEFVGGKDALMSWIEDNITYPISAEVNSIEGKVVVTFDVNSDGTVGNVQVKESVDPILNDEVVSKVVAMPNWIPAKQNGRTVKVKYTLPIVFKELS